MSNGSILHKRLGILYNVGDYELFHFNAEKDQNIKQKQDDSYSQISRMIYQRQYKVCAMDGGLPLMVRFSDKVEICGNRLAKCSDTTDYQENTHAQQQHVVR